MSLALILRQQSCQGNGADEFSAAASVPEIKQRIRNISVAEATLQQRNSDCYIKNALIKLLQIADLKYQSRIQRIYIIIRNIYLNPVEIHSRFSLNVTIITKFTLC